MCLRKMSKAMAGPWHQDTTAYMTIASNPAHKSATVLNNISGYKHGRGAIKTTGAKYGGDGWGLGWRS